MIRTTRAARVGAALAAATLVLTACGGGDEEATPTTPTDEESSSSGDAPAGDGTLTIGNLLPQTGDLAFLGPPEFAGVKLAVEEMNAAGGVLGQDVANIDADSGDGTPDIAGAEVDKLFNQDVDAIIGAAASGVSVSVIDKITGAGVVHFSPANTAAGFDTYDDNGLYFRTAPSDALQGAVLGNLAVEDGFSNVAVMARQDFYGEGLAEQVQTTLQEKGANVAEFVLYSADAQNYTAEVNKIAAAKPDALVLIAF
jgi:ABC-type branched-subunit amino acid transport system substrate-binding protein